MPSRHGSVHSLNSPPTSLLYTMSDMDLPPAQHPSLTNLDRYDMYDTHPSSTSASYAESSVGGGMPVRPKRKQVKNACSACQRACKRCDVGRPCERCIKYGMADSCRDSQRKERKKGIKRGPYKKRDGESAVPHDPDPSAHYLPGMISDLQRMSPKRMGRVQSVGQVDLSSASLIPIDVDPVPTHSPAQTLPLQIQSVPSAQYQYQTPAMIPASHNHTQTPPLSLAGVHQNQNQYQTHQQHTHQHHTSSNSHPQASSSYHHSEDQYYSTRYDQLAHAATRPAHYRTEESCSQSTQHQDYPRHVQQMQDYTRSPMLQYPSPEHSPPRERQYSERQYSNAVYHDNSSRHSMVQAVHHDQAYQSQSDSMAHDQETHDTRVMDPYYATHPHQQQHQRPYSSESHMHDVHQQQDQQQQPQSYYPSYNAYQQPSTSYGSSNSHSHSQQQQPQPQQYGYSQSHVPQQQQAMSASQNDAGYSQHLNYASASSSSMNAYPTQTHHQMDNNSMQLQYSSVRSPMKMVHRGSIDASAGMVAHPHHHSQHHHQHHSQHVGNVQIQSN
ncbi:unnamed protein product [Rhizoctonia solani]|uniref:Zn(2)-C6 fungal-type domain-containing protein n=1 Tax=Rhizoctonia solani TaxID=456999 RepID=A0A8H3C9F2_9AGAM|nr:unnamed protein product [Rhizoctonia solani]